MKIDKDVVLDFLREHGREDQVPQASQELPDHVDPERDSGLLSRFGIDLQDLLAKLPGNLGDKLPGDLGGKLGGILGN